MHPITDPRLLRAFIRQLLDNLLAQLDELGALPEGAPPLSVSRSNDQFEARLLVGRKATVKDGCAAGILPLFPEAAAPPAVEDQSGLKLTRMHKKFLEHAPVGESNRVKGRTLSLKAGYQKPGSHTRAAVADLVKAGLLRRHQDQKVYRPA